MTVGFATFAHPPEFIHTLHRPGVLRNMVATHRYPFSEILVVHQRCRGIEVPPFDIPVRVVESEDYPTILTEYGIPEEDPVLDELTHGPTSAHYWKWHTINHLIAAKELKTDYIVFSDCDCVIQKSEPNSWVEAGIDALRKQHKVLVVSPSDGAGPRMDKIMSQQMFLVERAKFMAIEWSKRWDGKFIPGGPFQEYYGMAEGRIGRYLMDHGMYRYVLSNSHRYWHHKPWNP